MSLSKEEWTELKRLVNKVQTNGFMELDSQDIDSLNEKVKSLSFAEKAALLNLSLTAVGVTLYDAGELFNTKIRIDDFSSYERVKRPYAHIIHHNYANFSGDLVETIDIFGSIRKNATFVGHPAVTFAISRWEKIVLAGNIIKQGNVYHRDETEREIDDLFFNSRVDNAKRYLKEIGEALVDGIKYRSVSTKLALSSEIERLGLREKNTYIFWAWKCLEKKWILNHCKKFYDTDELIEAIRQYLDKPLSNLGYDKTQEIWIYKPHIKSYDSQKVFNNSIKLETVIDFLKEGGKKFIEGKITKERFYDVDRPKFEVFSRAFASWYLRKASSTIGDYLEDAKNQSSVNAAYSDALSFDSSREKDIFQIIGEVFIKPLSEVREPIIIPDSDAFDIEKIIKQMGIK